MIFQVKIHKVQDYSYHLHLYEIPFQNSCDQYLVSHFKLVDFHPYGFYSSPNPNATRYLKYMVVRHVII